MSKKPDTSTDDLDKEILALARSQLGPVCERFFQDEKARAEVRRRVGQDADLVDSVLAEVHAHLGKNRRMADEFAAHFLFDLMKMGKTSMASTSKLRRFLDTGDLVLSVFGDLWGDIAQFKFESRLQFKSLFAQRMNWKAADQARRLDTGRRQEDKRVPQQPEELELRDRDPRSAPLPQSIQKEERERLILILLRLNDRDRKLLSCRLRGESVHDIAERLGMTYDTARKAVARAIEHARELAEQATRRRDDTGTQPA
ncbi:MAG: sigma-70 family RNA polymerase sigma factor [Planctomycetes bacterium]|nr:sigma-70 family RNA polymerase sigma factor [Planctomycetota bacterium]